MAIPEAATPNKKTSALFLIVNPLPEDVRPTSGQYVLIVRPHFNGLLSAGFPPNSYIVTRCIMEPNAQEIYSAVAGRGCDFCPDLGSLRRACARPCQIPGQRCAGGTRR